MTDDKQLDMKEAGFFAAAAARDAKEKNTINKANCSFEEVRRIENARMLFEMAYNSDSLLVNYRKKFNTIKIVNKRVLDKKIAKQLEANLAADGVVKVKTPQGLIYRFYPPETATKTAASKQPKKAVAKT
jgi:hypothetical protein